MNKEVLFPGPFWRPDEPSDSESVVVIDKCLAPPFHSSENLCEEAATEIVSILNDAKAKTIDLSKNKSLSDDERRLVLDTTANVTNRLQEIIESKMRLIVRDEPKVSKSELIDLSDRELSLSEACKYSYSSTIDILSRLKFELEGSLPEFDLDIDDKGNLIIDWVLEDQALEWTVMKCNTSWPTIRVYEYHRKKSGDNKRASVRTWHNIRSLVERFKLIVSVYP